MGQKNSELFPNVSKSKVIQGIIISDKTDQPTK